MKIRRRSLLVYSICRRPSKLHRPNLRDARIKNSFTSSLFQNYDQKSKTRNRPVQSHTSQNDKFDIQDKTKKFRTKILLKIKFEKMVKINVSVRNKKNW